MEPSPDVLGGRCSWVFRDGWWGPPPRDRAPSILRGFALALPALGLPVEGRLGVLPGPEMTL
ncbi:MAG: hypothetical protein AAF799_22815, partial [Myxococcota bacterium]